MSPHTFRFWQFTIWGYYKKPHQPFLRLREPRGGRQDKRASPHSPSTRSWLTRHNKAAIWWTSLSVSRPWLHSLPSSHPTCGRWKIRKPNQRGISSGGMLCHMKAGPWQHCIMEGGGEDREKKKKNQQQLDHLDLTVVITRAMTPATLATPPPPKLTSSPCP